MWKCNNCEEEFVLPEWSISCEIHLEIDAPNREEHWSAFCPCCGSADVDDTLSLKNNVDYYIKILYNKKRKEVLHGKAKKLEGVAE